MPISGNGLGTSNFAGAVLRGGRPVMIPGAEGVAVTASSAFPSSVAVAPEGQIIAGEPADERPEIALS